LGLLCRVTRSAMMGVPGRDQERGEKRANLISRVLVPADDLQQGRELGRERLLIVIKGSRRLGRPMSRQWLAWCRLYGPRSGRGAREMATLATYKRRRARDCQADQVVLYARVAGIDGTVQAGERAR
jgi:hypothetical protein